jgi:carbamoyl-phosphate synthase large subunit
MLNSFMMKSRIDKQCRVLVTGAGSGVGQGILKSLRLAKLPLSIIIADIAPMNAALYRGDEAVIIPRLESPGALAKMIEILHRCRIDVVMIGSEFDLSFFSEHRDLIQQQTGAIVIVAPLATVKIADDKWLTAEFLRTNGLPYAESYLAGSADEAAAVAGKWGYPIVLKSRQGTSSRHVHMVRDEQMLRQTYPVTPKPMLQKMLEHPAAELKSEYTCCVFKARDGGLVGPLTARRTVRGGSSWQVEVGHFEKIYPALLAIGAAMDFMGSLNIQLMMTARGPVPFEINARFSGTTAVRAHFGFNEPEMALRSFFYGEAISPPVIRRGLAFRYLEEVFVENVAAEELTPGVHKGSVNQWF